MAHRVLVANRGEIALRIVRALKDLGMVAVVAYATADADSMAVREADEAVCIGPPSPQESYLDPVRLIGAATARRCEAVHPGYGFLSENADFARVCRENDIIFIGPSPEIIERMGDKSQAKQAMCAAGVPCIPGNNDKFATVSDAKRCANLVGYPLLIKAVAGGGGKGMRLVQNAQEFERNYDAARSEALLAFGSDAVYLEKLIGQAHHIEVQIMADMRGNIAAFCERDCSVQRRHQKLIEETPSPVLAEAVRGRMCEVSRVAAEAVGYIGAGTLEYLLDEAGNFYFIEMNTRIQVEHGVTKEITRTDLVAEQIRIVFEGAMTIPDGIYAKWQGHAIEFRINAEDPYYQFCPSPGKVRRFEVPGGPGIRVDSHLYAGYTVPSVYDSLLAKLIVWGPTRSDALIRAQRALGPGHTSRDFVATRFANPDKCSERDARTFILARRPPRLWWSARATDRVLFFDVHTSVGDIATISTNRSDVASSICSERRAMSRHLLHLFFGSFECFVV